MLETQGKKFSHLVLRERICLMTLEPRTVNILLGILESIQQKAIQILGPMLLDKLKMTPPPNLHSLLSAVNTETYQMECAGKEGLFM